MMPHIPVELLIPATVPVVIMAAVFLTITLYASVVFNILLTGVEFGLLYPRILIFLVLFASLVYRMTLLKERVLIPNHVKLLLTLLALFAVWSLGIEMVYGLLRSEFSTILKRLSRVFLPILIVLCTLAICNSLNKVRKFLLFFVICASLSAFVAFMQFLGIDFFWMLRTAQTKALGTAGERVAGLANQAVGLSYALTLGFPWALSFVLSDELRQRWRKSVVIIPLLVLSLGTLATLTRSALLGCLLGGVYLLWRFRGIHALSTVLMVGVALTLVFAIGTGRFQRLTTLEEKSAIGRLPLAITGLAFAVKHPLGIGSFDNRYVEAIRANEKYYRGLVKTHRGAETIFHYTSHNHYINALVFWGWPGFMLLFLFIGVLFSGSRRLVNSQSPKINCYGAAFIGMLIAYFTNAFFHNGGPLLGDYPFWYFPGILSAILSKKALITRT